jgi:hypothetical protein
MIIYNNNNKSYTVGVLERRLKRGAVLALSDVGMGKKIVSICSFHIKHHLPSSSIV